MLATVFLIEAMLLGQADQPAQPKERPYWLEVATAHIQDCAVFANDKPEKPFRVSPDPVFHHVQNTRGKTVGSVFLFLDAMGRPAVVGDVFLFPRGNKHQLYNEWHSLASMPITVKWSGGTLMVCSEAGLKWNPIADAQSPADAPLQREWQMRQIVRRFTAHLLNKTNDKYELRLLTTPLYQYDAKDSDPAEATFLSGGLFAFCQETDPEMFLLIEAQRAAGAARWMFASAEFEFNLFMALDGKEVWKAEPPRFSSNGPHVGGHLKDVDLAAPATASTKEKR